MKLDSEEQRTVLLELLGKLTFSVTADTVGGAAMEIVRKAPETCEISRPWESERPVVALTDR